MKSFKKDGPSYNWEQSREDSVSEFLGIDIKTLDNGGFQFCQTGLIRKVLEAIPVASKTLRNNPV